MTPDSPAVPQEGAGTGVQSPASYRLLNRETIDEPQRIEVFHMVSPPGEGESDGRGGDGEPARKVALLVCHGMGQQVAFENIDLVASALENYPPRVDGAQKDSTASRVRFVRLGDQWLPRAEVDVGSGNQKVEAHVYEAYWAPLTEGRVKAFDVTRFLLEAGMRGLRYGLRGEFNRWVDGKEREYAITKKSVLSLIAVFATVICTLVLHAALGFVAIMQVLSLVLSPEIMDDVSTGLATILQARLLQSPLVLSLALLPFLAVRAVARTAAVGKRGKTYDGAVSKGTVVLSLVLAVGGIGIARAQPRPWKHLLLLPQMPAGAWIVVGVTASACLLFLFSRIRAYMDPPHTSSGNEPRAAGGPGTGTGPKRWAKAVAVGSAALAVVAAIWVCLVGGVILWDAVRWLGDPRGNPARPKVFDSRGFVFLFLASAWYASYQLRALYIQYMGDVAVYLSSHTLNEFAELRAQIRKIGYEAGCAIYGARREGPNGKPLIKNGKPVFEYDEVLVVGHSLGSVVAYDTLNAVLNEDVALGRKLNAEKRTRLLITFGSPLDKSAFIFRTQKEKADFREKLAAAVQPLIEPKDEKGNRKVREIPWINLFSPFDPVSGPVNYYDAPDGTPTAHHSEMVTLSAGRVVNLPDRDAVNFGHAHVTYWKNPLLAHLLHEAVTTKRTGPVPS